MQLRTAAEGSPSIRHEATMNPRMMVAELGFDTTASKTWQPPSLISCLFTWAARHHQCGLLQLSCYQLVVLLRGGSLGLRNAQRISSLLEPHLCRHTGSSLHRNALTLQKGLYAFSFFD
jgi:hypothetical protein